MASPEPTQELARDLGLLEAYTMGVGTMIGAGIFSCRASAPPTLQDLIVVALLGLIALFAGSGSIGPGRWWTPWWSVSRGDPCPRSSVRISSGGPAR